MPDSGASLDLSGQGTGGEAQAGQFLLGAGQALGGDALDALRGLFATAKQVVMTPGDVASGKYDIRDLPQVGRDYAAALTSLGLGLPGAPAGSLAMGKSAFHGTPHVFAPTETNPFGEFSDSAIGSGEGAQAYGWGHYVAGNPKVAEGYKQQLAGRSPVPADEAGNPLSWRDTLAKYYEPGSIVHGYGGLADKVIDFNPADANGNWSVKVQGVTPKMDRMETAKNLLGDPTAWEPYQGQVGQPRVHATMPTDKEIAQIGAIRNWPMTSPGALLEVHVKPEEEKMLDWDKPLGEQEPGIQQKLQQFNPPSDFRGSDIYNWISRSPEAWSSNITNQPNPGGIQQKASQTLAAAGIPGIKYLDAGSRNISIDPLIGKSGEPESWQVFDNGLIGRNGESKLLSSHPTQSDAESAADSLRTHNYVIFSPKDLRIIARNGQRLDPVDHDPFATGTQ